MRTKSCHRCHQTFPATTEFFADNFRNLDQLMNHCRKCGVILQEERRARKNERGKAWYAANREKAREVAKRSWDKNRAERLAYLREWRKQNRERINEYQRAYAERKRQDKIQSSKY